MSFKVTKKTYLICIAATYIVCLIFKGFVTSIFNKFLMETLKLSFSNNFLFDIFVMFIVILFFMIIVHEMLHGIAFKFFGGTVQYGFRGIYAYTREISGLKLTRTKFALVLLMPLMVISVFSLLLPGWLGGMIFLLNLLGSSGDVLMALYLIRVDDNSKIVDQAYGFEVIS